MDRHAILVWVHILLFVFWLGADLGVYIAAIWVKNPALSLAERAILLRIAAAVDLSPRLAFVLTMPVGLTLASQLGLPIGQPALLAIWLLALVWLAAILTMFRAHGSRLGQILARAQFGLLLVGGVAFAVAGLALLADGTIVPGWLAWKIVLFGIVFFIAIGIDLAFRPMATAFGRLGQEGSTPSVEGAIRRPINNTLVVVTVLYLVLLVISFLGTVKPEMTL
jgi:uncharacterized protein YhhL (DUF1145 family)